MTFPYADMPKSGFTGYGDGGGFTEKDISTSHNVVDTSDYKIYVPGTKMRYYNSTLKGWGTCIYLRYSKGAETLAAGYIVQPDPAETATPKHYNVTGDASTFVSIGLCTPQAIALSAMTTAYWGWFWCGGLCPDFFTSASARFDATTCASDDSLTAGEGFQSDLSTDGHLESWDTISVHTGQGTGCAGYVITDDGTTTVTMSKLILMDWWP